MKVGYYLLKYVQLSNFPTFQQKLLLSLSHFLSILAT